MPIKEVEFLSVQGTQDTGWVNLNCGPSLSHITPPHQNLRRDWIVGDVVSCKVFPMGRFRQAGQGMIVFMILHPEGGVDLNTLKDSREEGHLRNSHRSLLAST
jgi:hypothetical protein